MNSITYFVTHGQAVDGFAAAAQAKELFGLADDSLGEAYLSIDVAIGHVTAGDPAAAVDILTEAVTVFEAYEDPTGLQLRKRNSERP